MSRSARATSGGASASAVSVAATAFQAITTLRPSPQIVWRSPHLDGRELTPAWRLLLLGDGGPTRHFQLLSGEPVQVELLAMAADPGGDPGLPPETGDLEPPLLRRQVWLRCGPRTLAWAESWWNVALAERHLQDREQPIWRSLTADRAELFREVDGLALVQAPWLQQRWGTDGPFWSRRYRFFRGGRALTVIREVFSPALETWLGPSHHDHELLKKL